MRVQGTVALPGILAFFREDCVKWGELRKRTACYDSLREAHASRRAQIDKRERLRKRRPPAIYKEQPGFCTREAVFTNAHAILKEGQNQPAFQASSTNPGVFVRKKRKEEKVMCALPSYDFARR